MLTTTDNIYYMIDISLKTLELSVVVVSGSPLVMLNIFEIYSTLLYF